MEHRAAENSQLQQQMMDYMELQGCQCQDKVIEKEVFSGGWGGEGSLIVVGRGYSLFYSFIPEGDGACYVVDAIELLYKVCGLSASGRCFSGVALNYPFTTRGAIPDLFLLHSSAPPTAAHSDSRGQG